MAQYDKAAKKVTPSDSPPTTGTTPKSYSSEFLTALQQKLQESNSDTAQRNQTIEERDGYIYSDKLERNLDIPIGHDFTPVNWLRRTVEIHKSMFMGRPFSLTSVYDTQDIDLDDEEERQRRDIENSREKTLAEERRRLIDDIIRDNGGHAIFADGAESAAAVGTWVVKTWYDDKNERFVISPVEAVENCYAVWSRDDFRQFDVFAYAYQITKQKAAEMYDVGEDVATSPMGSPFMFVSPQGAGYATASGGTISTSASPSPSGQPMVTILEATGKVEGWKAEDGRLVPCPLGSETSVNCLYVGNKLVRLIADEKKQPKHYIFPNRRIRRRPWGVSDVSDAAININATYIETLSDWRTVASKINFPKLKGFNFGPDSTAPKFAPRKIQLLPLNEGQDMDLLPLGDANSIDWGRQLDELKEQFVRETGISRVLFDDPSITLNSNQALLTSLKPTSDIAENKKQLWGPILVEMFADAIETIAAFREDAKDLAEGNWSLKIQWPSVMQKEDPIFQQMLLNRWNAGTISLQSYLEMQGETKEEIDRMRDEFTEAITAAALGKSLPALAQMVLGLPSSQAEITPPGAVQATPAQNTPGAQPTSMPGSGATPAGPQGALNMTNQNLGG